MQETPSNVRRFEHPGRGGRARPVPKGRQVDPGARAEIEALLGERPLRRDLLIEHLHLIQDTHHQISAAHLAALADLMLIPYAEAYEVATFYLMFAVVVGMGRGNDGARFLLGTYSTFGVMAPALFGFGVSLALERHNGLLTLKRALPMPPAAYLLAKMVMAMLMALVKISDPSNPLPEIINLADGDSVAADLVAARSTLTGEHLAGQHPRALQRGQHRRVRPVAGGVIDGCGGHEGS